MSLKSPTGLPQDTLAAIRVVFFQECEEHLAELDAGLQALLDGDTDWEVINTVFRAAHSIKGGAGVFELEGVIRLAHTFESVLSEVRNGVIALTPADVKVLLRTSDLLGDMIHNARDGAPDDLPRVAQVTEALNGVLSSATGEDASDPFEELDFTPQPVSFEALEDQLGGHRAFDVRFRPYADLYVRANDPVRLMGELDRLGPITVNLDASALPLLDDLDPVESYLAWQVRLETRSSMDEVHEVFDFVEADCDLAIALAQDDALAVAIPPAVCFSVEDNAAAPVISASAPAPAAAPAAAQPASAPAPAATATAAAPEQSTIRVDLERVDRLINLVSELVINQAMLSQRIDQEALPAHSAVMPVLEELDALTRNLQDTVMSMRAQPVKPVFQRMSRLIREVEAMTGKPVRLITEGEATEVDRTVIEKLTDPLTHMIRNAVDHGIETADKRLAAGKPMEGTVRITAAHRAGRIVLEVSDDGGGIDRDKVRAIAIKRGLISADAPLSDEEIDSLILQPGFSTAETVTDLSGRGVGLDVVRQGVVALGGRLTIASRPGEGATMTLSLPLTLAVLDGMLVSSGGQQLVAPLTTLIESFKVQPGDVRRLGTSALLTVRGRQVPLIDLGLALGFPPQADCDGVALLVEDDAGEQAALLVDDILGQRQVVIKSLETNYHQVPGVAAATILGDGRVALILDVNAILSGQRHHARPEAA